MCISNVEGYNKEEISEIGNWRKPMTQKSIFKGRTFWQLDKYYINSSPALIRFNVILFSDKRT